MVCHGVGIRCCHRRELAGVSGHKEQSPRARLGRPVGHRRTGPASCGPQSGESGALLRGSTVYRRRPFSTDQLPASLAAVTSSCFTASAHPPGKSVFNDYSELPPAVIFLRSSSQERNSDWPSFSCLGSFTQCSVWSFLCVADVRVHTLTSVWSSLSIHMQIPG